MKRYTKDHEWVELDGDVVTVGITAHAAELLGDLVFIELPEVGATFDAEDDCAVVESVKAASDVYCPMAGEIVGVNNQILDAPEMLNDDWHTWMFKLRVDDTSQFESFMTEEEYEEICE